jgi:dienelactone hydrolase
VVVIFFSAVMAHYIERDFGIVDVEEVRIVDQSGYTIAAKLFRPVAASPDNKMPGILVLHGYQNDKDVENGFSIELARRGFVVLATNGLGHGDSEGMFNFGAFFVDPTYTMGTNTGYLYHKSLPFVDTTNMGVTGYSMGGIDSFKIAAMNPEIKAIVSQDGGYGTTDNHNVLDLYPTWTDMSGSTENLLPVDPTALGLMQPVRWDTTYGNFADGTARRIALITSNHHLLTLQSKSVAETVSWFENALKGGMQDALWINPSSQIYMWKEISTLVVLLVTMLSLIPLTNILLATPFFKPVAQPMPSRYIPSTRSWWLLATVNALLGGLIYLYVTAPNYDSSILGRIPFMRLQNMGNGLAIWFLANAIVFAVLFLIWYRGVGKKSSVTMYDMGVSFVREKMKFDWATLGKTLLLGVILFTWMYILEGISQWAFGEEFRFGWPFMRQFSDFQQFGYFLIYLIPALAFFLLNEGIQQPGENPMDVVA